jgi:hypothetical protein
MRFSEPETVIYGKELLDIRANLMLLRKAFLKLDNDGFTSAINTVDEIINDKFNAAFFSRGREAPDETSQRAAGPC